MLSIYSITPRPLSVNHWWENCWWWVSKISMLESRQMRKVGILFARIAWARHLISGEIWKFQRKWDFWRIKIHLQQKRKILTSYRWDRILQVRLKSGNMLARHRVVPWMSWRTSLLFQVRTDLTLLLKYPKLFAPPKKISIRSRPQNQTPSQVWNLINKKWKHRIIRLMQL